MQFLCMYSAYVLYKMNVPVVYDLSDVLWVLLEVLQMDGQEGVNFKRPRLRRRHWSQKINSFSVPTNR